MFSDPITLTTDWTTITPDAGENYIFPAIERNGSSSLYREAPDVDGTVLSLLIGHQYGKRARSTVRVTADGYTPDLIIDGNNSRFSQSCYVVFDAPITGPVNTASYSTAGFPLYKYMLKMIGGFLISVDTADTLFQRVLNGET